MTLHGWPENPSLSFSPILIGTGDIEVKNKTSEIAVRAFGSLYILPDTSAATFLKSCLVRYDTENSPEGEVALAYGFQLVQSCCSVGGRIEPVAAQRLAAQLLRMFEGDPVSLSNAKRFGEMIDLPEIIELVAGTDWNVFDPAVWQRKE